MAMGIQSKRGRIQDLVTRLESVAWGAGLALALLVLLAGPSFGWQGEPKRWVRAADAGARVRNFPDEQGLLVADVAPGRLMAVYDDKVGFVEVAIAGGLDVWVFGEYLAPTRDPNILRVTGSRVNIRPRVGTSVANLPLPTKLERGDLVALVERNDPSLPLDQDWARVKAPSSTRAFVKAAETKPVTDVVAARAEWQRAAMPLQLSAAAVAAPSTPSTPAGAAQTREAVAPAVSGDLATALASARTLFDSVRANRGAKSAEWQPVLAAWQRVAELAPAGSASAGSAARTIDAVEAYIEAASLQEDLAAQQAKQFERSGEDDEVLREIERKNSADWGRFDGRGWVRKFMVDGKPVYDLEWGGLSSGRVVCTSGRYDLDLFVGFELGVMGSRLRSAVGGTDGSQVVRSIDVHRIEVISGSGARRK